MIYKRKPDLSHFRTLGCKAYVHVHKPQRAHPFDPAAEVGTFVGYATATNNGYRIRLENGKIVETIHVTFAERIRTIHSDLHSTSGPVPEQILVPLHSVSNSSAIDAAAEQPLQHPTTTVVPKEPIINQQPSEPAPPLPRELANLLADELIPPSEKDRYLDRASRRQPRLPDSALHVRDLLPMVARALTSRITYQEAIKEPLYRQAMLDELLHLFEIGAVEVVDLPPDRKAIGCVWAHKMKYGPNGEFLKARSRLCPWGFQQEAGIDFDEDKVSAPTLHVETAMFLLSITVARQIHTRQADAKSAFANSKNHATTTYMQFPQGLKKIPGKALKLTNSINGKKQGAHDWHSIASESLMLIGFLQSVSDPSLYYMWTDHNSCLTLVGLYVDDFRIASDQISMLDHVQEALSKCCCAIRLVVRHENQP